MALYLVNTNPGDVADPLLPGTAVSFSLKSDTSYVRLPSLQTRIALSNIVKRPSLLLENDTELLKQASISVATPEHRAPIHSILPRSMSGQDIVIGPGTTNGIDAGIYEVKFPIETYSSVLAVVSFRVRAAWSKASRYFCDASDISPLYLGLEYGVRNSGLFVFLRDDGAGGSLVAGGPLLAYNSARNAEVELPGIGWTALADGDVFTVFLYADADAQEARIWTQGPTDAAPVVQAQAFPFSYLGEFQPASSSFSQRRDGPSLFATLYFGNAGGPADSVEIVDWGAYPYAPPGIVNGLGTRSHAYRRRPDLPVTFFAADNKSPIEPGLGRWTLSGVPLVVTPWCQPGRRSVPLYVSLRKELSGEGYLVRREPALAARQSGFSIEAWCSGQLDSIASIDTGFGFRVDDEQHLYQVTAVDSLRRSFGVVKDPAQLASVENGYYTVTAEDGLPQEIDYQALRLVRLTLDRLRDELRLFVEDMDTPFLVVPISSSAFPGTRGHARVEIGHLGDADAGSFNIAALSYMHRYLAWESEDGTPDSAPAAFLPVGAGDASTFDGALYIPNTLQYRRNDDFAFSRGFQVDFRASVQYAGDPAQWTGSGLTIFLGRFDSPLDLPCMLHVGFFDCGAFGPKIAITPASGEQEIIAQTELGKLYSADVDWSTMTSFRLVYRPGYRVELFGPGLIKDTPLISIPWDQFSAQSDPSDTSPGIAFGGFSSVPGASTWKHVRWGISRGFEVELTQEPSGENYFKQSFGGRASVFIEAQEESSG